MEDIDIGELLQSAISGNINNDTFFKKIVNLFGKEIKSTIKILGSILIIIIIHSILKSISDGLENKSISTITYYVQYILIVTLIMSNFADIISLTKQSIQNMLGYGQTLVPLLMTLLLTTGSITSAGVIEGKDVVASLQKLHGNGVGLAPAAPGVAAARQDEDGRTGVEGGHLDGPIAQIPDELCAAGESVGVYLHDGFFFLWYFYGKGSFFLGMA